MPQTILGISTYALISLVCFIPAMVCHEVAHGWVAHKLGDPTAAAAGRLTLNPLKHIDPFGTIILPVLLLLVNMPVFGYAKPVPYNPAYFKNLRKGELLVGFAGPAANLVLALLGAILGNACGLLYINGTATGIGGDILSAICEVFMIFSQVNLVLLFFNIIPIPPLDGSSIIAIFLNDHQLARYYSIQQYALPILMVLLIVVPYVFGINPISTYLNATAGNLTDLFYYPVLSG
jgi:Zn-dependent protease